MNWRLIQKAAIIPDIADELTPKCFLSPSYGNVLVEYGTHFNTSDTKFQPSIFITCPDYDPKGTTLVLTDPDAPSSEDPKWAEMCHWIAKVGGVDLVDVIECKFPVNSSTDVWRRLLQEKIGGRRVRVVIPIDKAPGPPQKNTGFHRYVFLLLDGENGNLKGPSDRQHWGTGKVRHGVRDWAKKEGLKVIGANFFFEQNEEQ
ncbi:phosphatidylethanolamine-binding protein [Bisporella sp. PMI_857]|nr:phosphatidylethanolamine-binding protein [Bisporella sp. PMI_857]